MSESDVLAIQLWLGAAAIAVAAVGMTAAGWNHRYFVRSMFGITGALALCAIFWRKINLRLPAHADESLLAIAANPISWFVIFIAAVVVIVLLTKSKAVRQISAPAILSSPNARAGLTVSDTKKDFNNNVPDAVNAENQKSSSHQQKNGNRTYVGKSITPEYLISFFKEHTAIQAKKLSEVYIGKWMEISGVVREVTPIDSQTEIAMLTFKQPSDLTTLFFRTKKWVDRVSGLRRGDSISAVGQIDKVVSSHIELEHCELVD